jgi:hypothetical protein
VRRPATPANDSKAGTPAAEAKPANGANPGDAGARSKHGVNSQIAFEQQMLDTIEIDLGDF